MIYIKLHYSTKIQVIIVYDINIRQDKIGGRENKMEYVVIFILLVWSIYIGYINYIKPNKLLKNPIIQSKID